MSETTINSQAAAPADITDPARLVELGMQHFDNEQYDEALATFQAALQLDPTMAAAYNGIGRVYYHTCPEHAEAAYQRAIDLDPQYVDPYYGIGILHVSKFGDYDRGIAAFELGLERNPEETWLYMGIGTAQMRAGRFAEAEAALLHLARVDPDDPHPYGNLGILYLYLRRYDDAIAALRRGIELHPADHSHHRVLGFVYERLGRVEEAVAELETAVRCEPSDYEARGALGRLLRAVEREGEAEEHVTIGREQAARDDAYGRACWESVSGNLDEAVRLLEIGLSESQVTPGWARIDPEFTFLQDDPRYQALLAR
jgi:Flp pilus assembly protein TadD